MKTKAPPKQTPYIMKSALTKQWYIVTRYEQKRGMCAIGPDAGKDFDYLIAKEKFDVTEQMTKIITAELIAATVARMKKPVRRRKVAALETQNKDVA